jgi:hypothetical protein
VAVLLAFVIPIMHQGNIMQLLYLGWNLWWKSKEFNFLLLINQEIPGESEPRNYLEWDHGKRK